MPNLDEAEQQIQTIAATIAQVAHSSDGNILAIHGGGTKPALYARHAAKSEDLSRRAAKSYSEPAPAATAIDTRPLNGIIQYQPGEFLITAYAGTTLQELTNVLAEQGQYLPFDPPRVAKVSETSQATLGGAVASGINGPGRWRYGGIRDFVMECRFVDGQGKIRVGGRRVVKNAAGFDIPKLLTGSCGRFGMLADVTVKVFPRPVSSLTIHVFSENLEAAAATISQVAMQPWELDALEIQPDGSLLIRIAGEETAVSQHSSRLQKTLPSSGCSFLVNQQQDLAWQARHQWIWDNPEMVVVRVPLNIRVMLDLDEELEEMEIQRCYGSGGNVAWLKWEPQKENPGSRLKRVSKLLAQFGLRGMLVHLPASVQELMPGLMVGTNPENPFYNRLKQVFDPFHVFGEFDAA